MSPQKPALKLRRVLASNVRRARKARAWSQEQLAEATGLTQVSISQIETAKAAASVDTIEKIADGLGTEPSILLHR